MFKLYVDFDLPRDANEAWVRGAEAQHVVLVEPQVSPAVEAQAIGRVDRIGQSRETWVHRFVVEASIEENVHRLCSERAAAMDLSAAATSARTAKEERLTVRYVLTNHASYLPLHYVVTAASVAMFVSEWMSYGRPVGRGGGGLVVPGGGNTQHKSMHVSGNMRDTRKRMFYVCSPTTMRMPAEHYHRWLVTKHHTYY
jgi:hypothetical protein